MAPQTQWLEGIDGDFLLNNAVFEVVSAESWGISAWTKTAKITVTLAGGSPARYFLKCVTGRVATTLTWGECYSAEEIEATVPGFGPKPIGKGDYYDDEGTRVYFFLMTFHDLDLQTPPDPVELARLMAELHRKGTSPNGMFGYPVTTGGGVLARTVTWEKSWAAQYTHQLKDVIKLDNESNGPWPEYDAACKQVIDHVIPRLLGILQEGGRKIKPSLVHLDIWEGNVATDMETGKIVIFDPGCCYTHNEIEFGTWRCSWATHFNSPVYMKNYQREITPSEPEGEWDDRNRLYSIRAALCDSAGHPGSSSRVIAYNDMLYLCERYAPLASLEKYDPAKDISVTGVTKAYDVMAGVKKTPVACFPDPLPDAIKC